MWPQEISDYRDGDLKMDSKHLIGKIWRALSFTQSTVSQVGLLTYQDWPPDTHPISFPPLFCSLILKIDNG